MRSPKPHLAWASKTVGVPGIGEVFKYSVLCVISYQRLHCILFANTHDAMTGIKLQLQDVNTMHQAKTNIAFISHYYVIMPNETASKQCCIKQWNNNEIYRITL